MPVAVALDIGATKIAAALVDSGGRIVSSGRVGTRDVARSPAELTAALGELVTTVAAPVGLDGVAGIGVSSAGPVDLVAGVVSPVNIPELRGVEAVNLPPYTVLGWDQPGFTAVELPRKDGS